MAAFLCDPEHDAHELAIGGYPWSRREIMALPVTVRRQHIEWCRDYHRAQAEAWEKGSGGG